MASGIFSKTIWIMVPWTTPAIISGYLATGHISGAVLQVVLIAVDSLVYVYFFKKADKRKVQAQMANAKKAETQA